MILIEFEENITDDLNILKYRNVQDEFWNYLYINVETLHLLLINFGILSTKRIPTENIYLDNPSTSKNITINFCGASIELYCGNNTHIYLPILEQNY